MVNKSNRIYRLVSLVLAGLLTISSTGYSIDLHFCQGALKTVSFIGKAKTCHDIAESSSNIKCKNHQKKKVEIEDCKEDNNCCSNKSLYFHADIDQNFQSHNSVVTKDLQQFIVAFIVVNFQNALISEKGHSNFVNYKPPLIQRDIPIFIQSFLL